jgi:uncharacterized radical SAM superfamily Fe-S cluster-containing enzyme
MNSTVGCVIHHATPSGKVYPFCVYNSGPYFREKTEKEFSVPFDLKAAKKNGNGLVQLEN